MIKSSKFKETLEKFKKEYPYTWDVFDDVEFYYYERIIKNMGINSSEWNKITIPYDVCGYYLTDCDIIKYGFKREQDLLYFRLAVPGHEKNK